MVNSNVVSAVMNLLNNDKEFYQSSGLQSLVGLLDYAYYDLQAADGIKTEALYEECASERFSTEDATDLLPYFSQPRAMLHCKERDYLVTWAYSFWARRWADNRTSLCRHMLDDLLKIYPNTDYKSDKMVETEQRYRNELLGKQQSQEKLLTEIRNSFADTTRPSQEETVMNYSEEPKRAEVRDKFLHYEWSQVPRELLYQERDALHYFTPAGFRYYLPAFLTALVEDYEMDKEMNSAIVWTLTYRLDEAELRNMQRDRFSTFSSEQGTAICHVLRWLLVNHSEDFINPSDNSSELWRAINSWWIKYE